jgi:hypothetical protein
MATKGFVQFKHLNYGYFSVNFMAIDGINSQLILFAAGIWP